MEQTQLELLQDLGAKMGAYSNGVLPLLKSRGIEVEEPSLKALYDASLIDAKVIEEVIKLCYPNGEVANAWTDIVASVGRGLSAAFTKPETTTSNAAEQMLVMQQQQEMKAAESRKQILMYVGIFIALLVVGGVTFALVKKRGK